MSVTIDSLDIQIKSSAGSAANNIRELSKALTELNGNAKVTKITNALGKLSTELNGLKGSYVVIGELAKLSHGLAKLGAVPKMTSLHSALNALKKLPEVMAGLDASEIEEFADAMKKLADGLEPLATQIDKIGTGFSKLPAKVNQCVSSIKQMDKTSKSSGGSFAWFGLKLTAVYHVARKVADAVSGVVSEAVEWDGISARFGRAFGDSADEVYERVQKISDAMKINKQEFMQYSSLYGSLLKGFGMDDGTSSTIAVGMAELSYDIWAANNDRYKTIEDAAEALRSAITGEIEPARNAGIALSNATLQEYLDTHTQLQMSVNEMTEAQKAELRYAVMVNSARQQGIVGTYAKEMQTAEGAIRTLTEQLKTLGQALGGLILPILQKLVPWVSAFVELLTEGIHKLADLFGVKLQQIQWDAPSGTAQTAENLENMAESAKKIKQYTAGFDELNIMGDSSDAAESTGADGGTLGLNLSTVWDDSVFADASEQIDKLKQKIKDYVTEHENMLVVVGTVAAFMTFADAVERINKLVSGSALVKFAEKMKDSPLAGVMTKIGTAVQTVAGVFGAPVWAAAAVIIAAIGSVVYFLYQNWQSVVNVAKEFFEENIVPKLEAIKESWDKIKESLSTMSPLFEKIGVVFEVVGGIIFAVVVGVFEAVVQVIVGFAEAVSGIVQIVSGVATAIVRFITGDIRGGFDALGDMVLGVEALFWGLLDGTIGAVAAFVHGVIDWCVKLWDELVGHSIIPDMINAIVDWFLGMPKRVFKAVEQFATGVIERCKNLWSSIKQWYNSTVAPKFTASYWVNVFSNLKVGFTQTVKNMLNSGIDMLNKFISWINSKLCFSWDAIPWLGIKGGSIQLFTIPTITQRFEKGGFIEDGLFTMNHGEIAGKFNNGKSVVANNEQIVAGIASGVSSANEDLISVLYTVGRQIVDAVNAKDTSVHIDTRRITTAQNQRSRAYGV